MPWCTDTTNTGSRSHARKWRKQLEGCNSPSDANDIFFCYRIGQEPTPEGRTHFIPDVSKYASEDRPLALIHSYEGGDWIICVHTPTHGPRSGSGGGTAVVKDSKGKVTAYLGHICDQIWFYGDSLEDFYFRLEEKYTFKKVISYN